jgi:hypothetical protein
VCNVQVEELNIDLEPGDVVDDILGESSQESLDCYDTETAQATV